LSCRHPSALDRDRLLRLRCAGHFHDLLNVAHPALDIFLAPFDPLAGLDDSAGRDQLTAGLEPVVFAATPELVLLVEVLVDRRGSGLWRKDEGDNVAQSVGAHGALFDGESQRSPKVQRRLWRRAERGRLSVSSSVAIRITFTAFADDVGGALLASLNEARNSGRSPTSVGGGVNAIGNCPVSVGFCGPGSTAPGGLPLRFYDSPGRLIGVAKVAVPARVAKTPIPAAALMVSMSRREAGIVLSPTPAIEHFLPTPRPRASSSAPSPA
jgi:hypothetical protein